MIRPHGITIDSRVIGKRIGYELQVGCRTFCFSSHEAMLLELKNYLDSPIEIENLYNEVRFIAREKRRKRSEEDQIQPAAPIPQWANPAPIPYSTRGCPSSIGMSIRAENETQEACETCESV